MHDVRQWSLMNIRNDRSSPAVATCRRSSSGSRRATASIAARRLTSYGSWRVHARQSHNTLTRQPSHRAATSYPSQAVARRHRLQCVQLSSDCLYPHGPALVSGQHVALGHRTEMPYLVPTSGQSTPAADSSRGTSLESTDISCENTHTRANTASDKRENTPAVSPPISTWRM